MDIIWFDQIIRAIINRYICVNILFTSFTCENILIVIFMKLKHHWSIIIWLTVNYAFMSLTLQYFYLLKFTFSRSNWIDRLIFIGSSVHVQCPLQTVISKIYCWRHFDGTQPHCLSASQWEKNEKISKEILQYTYGSCLRNGQLDGAFQLDISYYLLRDEIPVAGRWRLKVSIGNDFYVTLFFNIYIIICMTEVRRKEIR